MCQAPSGYWRASTEQTDKNNDNDSARQLGTTQILYQASQVVCGVNMKAVLNFSFNHNII